MMSREIGGRLFWITLFAVAFAFVEASVVVYLRALYYPGGFTFPLKLIEHHHLVIELSREIATIVMLLAIGWIAGTKGWERFGYFLVSFGLWDIFFYIWLKVTIGWPSSFTEWDILFLVPAPWIGPVLAPVLISLTMIGTGASIVVRISRKAHFHPHFWSWVLSVCGIAVLLWSFLRDTGASLNGLLPQPYPYELLMTGLLLSIAGFVTACKPRRTLSP